MSSRQAPGWDDGLFSSDDEDDALCLQLVQAAFTLLQEESDPLDTYAADLQRHSNHWATLQDDMSDAHLPGPGSRGQPARRGVPHAERMHPHGSAWWKMLLRGESGQGQGMGCRVECQ